MTYDNRQFFIDGAWVNPIESKEFQVINPATEAVAGVISMGSAKDVDLPSWRRAAPSRATAHAAGRTPGADGENFGLVQGALR